MSTETKTGAETDAYVSNNPWLVIRRGAIVGRHRSVRDAIRWADRRRHLRDVGTLLKHRVTGETWGYGRAGWHKVADPRPQAGSAAA